MTEFAKKNMDVSNWLMSARTIFQQRVKMEKECKEIAITMRNQAQAAGQSNTEELEVKIEKAIEQYKEDNYEIFDSATDPSSSEDDEGNNEKPEIKYKTPNVVKRYGLPRLYSTHEKPKEKEKLYTNSPLYHPTYDRSNLIIKSKGHAVLGGGFTIYRPAVSIGIHKNKNWKGHNKFKNNDMNQSIKDEFSFDSDDGDLSSDDTIGSYEEIDEMEDETLNRGKMVQSATLPMINISHSGISSDISHQVVSCLLSLKVEDETSEGKINDDSKNNERTDGNVYKAKKPKDLYPLYSPPKVESKNNNKPRSKSTVERKRGSLNIKSRSQSTLYIQKTPHANNVTTMENTIKSFPTTKLCMSGNKLGYQGIDAFINKSSDSLRMLKYLDISSNSIGPKGCQAFARALRCDKGASPSLLEYLNLSNNKMGDKSVQLLCRYIARFTLQLKTLILDNNLIAQRGATGLSTTMSRLKQLKHLSIKGNQIAHDGAATLGGGLAKNKSLTYLDVSYNALGKCEDRRSTHSWARGLRKHKNLLHLIFSYNSFDYEDCRILADGLSKNNILLGIHFDGNEGQINARGHIIPRPNWMSVMSSHVDNASTTTSCQRVSNKWKVNDTCWICGGWRKTRFSFTPRSIGFTIDKDNYKILQQLWEKHIKMYYLTLEDLAGTAWENDDEEGFNLMKEFRKDGKMSYEQYKQLLENAEREFNLIKGSMNMIWTMFENLSDDSNLEAKPVIKPPRLQRIPDSDDEITYDSDKEETTLPKPISYSKIKQHRYTFQDFFTCFCRIKHKTGAGGKKQIKKVVLVVDFDKPIQMTLDKATNVFHVVLMCPPGRLKYHFLVDGASHYACDQSLCIPSYKIDPVPYPIDAIKALQDQRKKEFEEDNKRSQRRRTASTKFGNNDNKNNKKKVKNETYGVEKLIFRNVVTLEPYKGEWKKLDGKTVLESESQTIPRSKRPKLKLAAKKVSPWKKSSSVFAPFRTESGALRAKAFNADWKRTSKKIQKFVKDPAEIEALKDIFEDHWAELKNVYKYYSMLNGSEPFYLGINAFTDFCQDSKMLDKYMGLKDIDTIFIATNYTNEKMKNALNNPDRAVVRYQFIEAITRLGNAKFGSANRNLTPETALPISDAVEKLIFMYILPNCKKLEALEFRHDVLYHSLPIDDLLKENMDEIERVYRLYAASIDVPPPGQKRVMSVREFEALCSQIKSVHKWLNQRDILAVFLASKQLSVDEIKKSEHRILVFVEFIESIARLAQEVGMKKREKELQAAKEAEAERLEIERKEKKKKKKKGNKKKGGKKSSKLKISALDKLKNAAFKIGKTVVEEKQKQAAEADGTKHVDANNFALAGAISVALDVKDNLYQYLTLFLEELAMVGKVQPKQTSEVEGEEREEENDADKTLESSLKSIVGLNSPGSGSDYAAPLSPLSPQ